MGYCYEKGIGIKQNIEEAIKCYRVASKIDDYDTKNGYAPSQYKIARICEDGKYGFEKDENLAYELYYLSAKNKYLRSRYRLALCYKRGIGIRQDIIKSKYMLEELVRSVYNKARHSLHKVNNKIEKSTKKFFEELKKPNREVTLSDILRKEMQLKTQLNKIIKFNEDLVVESPNFDMYNFVCSGSTR